MMFYRISAREIVVPKKDKLTKEKLDDTDTRLEACPKKIISSFDSSVGAGKKYSSYWYKVAKVTALQNYINTWPFASRLQSKDLIL
jgi:hypothetical protein